MAGIKTNTKDLGKAATKFFSAIQGEDARRNAAIEELTRKNTAKGMGQEQARLYANHEYTLKQTLCTSI